MLYIKGNVATDNQTKYVVTYYDSSQYVKVTFAIDQGVPFDVWKGRLVRAVLLLVGVTDVQPHRLIHDLKTTSVAVDYWIYLSEEEEAQVNEGRVSDQQVLQLFANTPRDAHT